MHPDYGRANIIPGVSFVVDTITGRSARVVKMLNNAVQVTVKQRGYELENWPWSWLTMRQPRLIKRYPRPFRFPRDEQTPHCHCKIGKMEVKDEETVVCTRCKQPIGTESFPRRIQRATDLVRKSEIVAYIPILNSSEVSVVDKKDARKVLKYEWKLRKGYAVAAGTNLRMHHVVLGLKPSQEVDHESGIKLDNRRGNLRPCSHAQNMANRKIQKNNKSGYKGVSSYRGQWRAQISSNGKVIFLGIFSNPEKAARIYDKAALKYYGRFARTNFDVRETGSEKQTSQVRQAVSRRKRKVSRRSKDSVKARRKSSGKLVLRPTRRSDAKKQAGSSSKRSKPLSKNRKSAQAVPKRKGRTHPVPKRRTPTLPKTSLKTPKGKVKADVRHRSRTKKIPVVDKVDIVESVPQSNLTPDVRGPGSGGTPDSGEVLPGVPGGTGTVH